VRQEKEGSSLRQPVPNRLYIKSGRREREDGEEVAGTMMTWMNEGKEGKKKEERSNLVFRIFDDQIDGMPLWMARRPGNCSGLATDASRVASPSSSSGPASLVKRLHCHVVTIDFHPGPTTGFLAFSLSFGCCVRAVSQVIVFCSYLPPSEVSPLSPLACSGTYCSSPTRPVYETCDTKVTIETSCPLVLGEDFGESNQRKWIVTPRLADL
jgi:hypothetical protein